MNIYDHFAHEDEYPELNIEAMSERLAKALSFKTVYTDAETTDWSQFDGLQQHIVDSFPYVMTAASNVEVVGHSLLIEIPGSNHELPALMLIAHQDVVPVVPGTEDAWTHDPFGGDVDDTY
ncbi:MAG: peptidase M20, partial [Atopobium sp.]|nr:peptidase M20 [Atopobium sp.]